MGTESGKLWSSPTPTAALEQAFRFAVLAESLREPVTPEGLLHIPALERAMRSVAGIHGWLPVSSFPENGYVSWLGKLRVGGELVVATQTRLITDILRNTDDPHRKKRARSKLLAVTAHEIGHEFMRPCDKRRTFVTNMGRWVAARRQTLRNESEAWLFAGFLRAIVLAAVAGNGRPDRAHEYA